MCLMKKTIDSLKLLILIFSVTCVFKAGAQGINKDSVTIFFFRITEGEKNALQAYIVLDGQPAFSISWGTAIQYKLSKEGELHNGKI
jgi:hypothetical protein